MKILMLNNEFPPLGGGTGTVNSELLKQFKKYPEFKIDLITSEQGKKKIIENFSDNIRIIKYPVNNKNIHHATNFELIKYTLKASFAALKYHRKEKYDLSFAWSTVPAGFVSFLLRILKKLPFIVRVGGPDIPGFEQRYNTIYKLISPLIKLIWKKSDLLIAKCRTEFDMITAINNKLKIDIFYNGVDTEKFKPKDKVTETNALNIICPARLIQRKGQDLLIKAVANLKKEDINFEVKLIGEGDEKENFTVLCKKLNVSENIKFLGYVPREAMLQEYQSSDIFCLPSYNEGMSNALLEAMSCGLPAIVTNVGGTEELVDDSNGFIFKAGDKDALTEILKNIYKNKSIIKQLGKNSRLKALKFSWRKIADDYAELFRNQ